MLILNFSFIDSQYEDKISFVTFIFLVLMDSHYEDHVTLVGISDQLLISHPFYYPFCLCKTIGR